MNNFTYHVYTDVRFGKDQINTLPELIAPLGKKVLLVDLDSQSNATSSYGVIGKDLSLTSYDLLINENVEPKEAIIHTKHCNVDLIGSSIDLAGAEIELIGVENREFILKKLIDPVRDQYDFIIIDCPPALSMLTINAMTTANSVIVPIQCEYYALEGLSQLLHTINLVSERLNPSLEIEGIVFTMYDSRTNLSMQVVENVRANLGGNVYDSIIPRNIRLAEAPSYGLPIIKYDPKSAGAEAYMALATEVINKE